MKLQFPDNIDVETFFSEYWQRKPLLLRNALPDDFFTLQADELAGLATDPELESRLVLEHGETPWSLRHGPFSEQDFADLPDSHWTLLVQDIDKFIPDIHQLLRCFSFIPDWRLDDAMVSYATDQGSVGPHIDSYDVFLLQASGRRRWRIGAPDDVAAGLLEDAELGILKQFTTQEEWLLEPGDALYIPPNIPHWGIAEGECMTCSIGFRAPSRQEMLDDWTQTLLEQGLGADMYRDPPLHQQAVSAEIDEAAFVQASKILDNFTLPEENRRRWFGQLVTQPKMHLQLRPPSIHLNRLDIVTRLQAGDVLLHHPFTRMACASVNDNTFCLFANGKAFNVPQVHSRFVTALCDKKGIDPQQLLPFTNKDQCINVLLELINSGTLAFDE